VLLSPQNQSLEEIAEFHALAREALVHYHDSSNPAYSVAFAGLTADEVAESLDTRITELELRSIFDVLASVEASLRIDFALRVSQREKDPLSRDFREVYRKNKSFIRLEEGILARWRGHHPGYASLISELGLVLEFRHWLAHGRYWSARLSRDYDYYNVSALAEAVTEVPSPPRCAHRAPRAASRRAPPTPNPRSLPDAASDCPRTQRRTSR